MSDPHSQNLSPTSQFLAREFPLTKSPLIARLQLFLPKIEAENAKLKENTVIDHGISVEKVDLDAVDEEENESSSSNRESSKEASKISRLAYLSSFSASNPFIAVNLKAVMYNLTSI